MSIRDKIKRIPLGDRNVNSFHLGNRANNKQKDLQEKPQLRNTQTTKDIRHYDTQRTEQKLQNEFQINRGQTQRQEQDASLTKAQNDEEYERQRKALQRHHLKLFGEFVSEAQVYIDHTFLNAGPNLAQTNHLKALFAKTNTMIVPFFSDQVDLIISRRKFDPSFKYPDTDIFSKVNNSTLRVWSYTKCLRILKFLGIDTSFDSAISKGSHDLSSLLEQEKVNKKPVYTRGNTKEQQSQMHYFSHSFIYSYDLRKKHAPVALKEWEAVGSWPGFHATVKGKSLFLRDVDSPSDIELWKSRRNVNGEKARDLRRRIREICVIENDFDIKDENLTIYAQVERSSRSSDYENDDNAQSQKSDIQEDMGAELGQCKDKGKSTSVLSSPIKISTTSKGDKQEFEGTPCKDQEAETSSQRITNINCAEKLYNRYQNATVDTNATNESITENKENITEQENTDFAEPLQFRKNRLEFMASGAAATNSSVATNNLSTNAQAMIHESISTNPFLIKNENMKRRIVEDIDPTKKKAKVESLRKKSITTRAQKKVYVEKMKDLHRCENCNMHFSDFKKHCQTKEHKAYARNDANFEKIDNFIALLRSERLE